jgi:HSP20 family molecular chaperone IbpA
MPAVNLSEDESNFTVEVVAPGYKKDDFKLKVDDDVLTISAETKMKELKEEMEENIAGGNILPVPLPAHSVCLITQRTMRFLRNTAKAYCK